MFGNDLYILTFALLLCLIPLTVLAAYLGSARFKGLVGETIVNLTVSWFLSNKDYYLLKDVILPSGSGTTQIDHIIVSRYGVFVVETKNMKGWIFGDANQRTWTQVIYKHKSGFQNPIHQNFKHLVTLESLLELPRDAFHSAVVFVGKASFRTPMPSGVTYTFGFLKLVKSKRDIVLSDNQVQEALTKISERKLASNRQTRHQHVASLRAPESDKICPRCGSNMVLRTARKGPNKGNSFWGCSRYPNCRAIVDA